MLLKYSFKAKLWKYKGKGSWYFVTLPPRLSARIRRHHGLDEEGWGRLKADAKVGQSNWRTAIWYDSKYESYLLPIKSNIRKTESVSVGSTLIVELQMAKTEE
jgi:hypothetical protein